MRVIALHGFLGLPSDWHFLEREIANLESVDLWNSARDPSLGATFSSWAQKFNVSTACKSDSENGDPKPLLVGYSMGGRLALHAALLEPKKWSGAIFVSAHPGLLSPEARAQRLEADQKWAQRFLNESWLSLMSGWNSQSVLQSSAQTEAIILERNEADFERQKLAFGMDAWSLGRQGDLRLALEKLELPVLFLSGAADEKFTSLLKTLHLNSCQEHRVVLGAGHRLPWEQPKEFMKIVKEFQRKL